MSIFRLAWRSLWRHKRRTLITIISIAAGLTFSIFFVSLAFGTYHQLMSDAVRMQAGHITLEHNDYREAPAVDLWVSGVPDLEKAIAAIPGVERTKPLILAQGVAKSGTGSQGIVVIGVNPLVEQGTSPLAKNIIAGSYLSNEDASLAVIGSELAKHLNLEVGKKFVVTTNDVHGALVEELLRVKGVFQTGSEEVDAYLIQIPLSQARKIYGLPEDGVTELGVVLKEDAKRRTVFQAIKKLPKAASIKVYHWEEILPEVAAWIQLDRGSNFIFQGMLLFLILFTIFNTLFMSVLERRREFAVLLALGTPPATLRLQIFLESVLIGALGSILGIVFGSGIALIAQIRGIDIRRFYSEGVSISGFAVSPILHARLTPELLLILGGIVFFATVLVSLPSIHKAAQISLVEWLRE